MSRFGKNILTAVLVFFSIIYLLPGQPGDNNLLFRGYLTNMQSIMFQHVNDPWYLDNLVHNRLQLKWFANDHITTDLELRTRFFFGNSLQFPEYKDLYTYDPGWVDLTFTLASGNSYLLLTTLDRAWVNYRAGHFEVRAGRQRINWSKTMVWNPNDIFNASSFFDFDYPEKPGCTALRMNYYTGASSDVEVSIKVDNNDKVTAAGILRLNPGMYDLQFFGGILNIRDLATGNLNSRDIVAGAGWSGNIKDAGFSGEITLFQPWDSAFGNGDVMVSVNTNYTFQNSLALMFEFLYSSIDYTHYDFLKSYYIPLSVKYITFTDFNLFGQVSYPFTPLFNGSLAAIYYPSIRGYFLGPSLTYSLQDNVDLSLFLQYFNGENNYSREKEKVTFAFLRLKWSF